MDGNGRVSQRTGATSATGSWVLPVVAAAALSVGVLPVPAVAAPVIQPGVSIGNCTLNWIYDGTGDLAGKVYGGTAAHCVGEVGQRISLYSGTGGTVIGDLGAVAYIDDDLDYALVEIDHDLLGSVNPALKGHPEIPTGVSTRKTTQTGDVIQFSSHGTGFHLHPLTQEKRVAALSSNDGTHYYAFGPASPGDSGGPVADVTDGNKALGTLNNLTFCCQNVGVSGVSIEGMLADAAEAGFTVELRTVGSSGPAHVTRVKDVTATVTGGSIAIDGQATFVDVPGRVGQDPVGDAATSGGAGGALPIGDDLVSATIARPDPMADLLTFTLGVANQPAGLDGLPEAMRYHWDIAVDDAEPFTLEAVRTELTAQSADPVFRILRGSTVVAEVTGVMAGGEVEWQVPMGLIEAAPDSVIEPGEDVMSVVSASGPGGPIGQDGAGDAIAVADYPVPGPAVWFGIAPAGTPAEEVSLTTSGTVQSGGAFVGALPPPADPGDYIVVVQACHGPSNCGLGATDITLP